MDGVAGDHQRGLFTQWWFVDIFGSSRAKEFRRKEAAPRPRRSTELLLERIRNAECAFVVYSYENKWAYT